MSITHQIIFNILKLFPNNQINGALPFITCAISISKFHHDHTSNKIYWCYSESSEFYHLNYVPVVDWGAASKRYVQVLNSDTRECDLTLKKGLWMSRWHHVSLGWALCPIMSVHTRESEKQERERLAHVQTERDIGALYG